MTAGGKSRRLRLYAVHGLGYQPTCIWLDERGDFFAQVDSWFQLVPEEWESTGKELLAAQDARLDELRRRADPRGFAACQSRHSSSSMPTFSMPRRAR